MMSLILLIEDDVTFSTMLKRFLEKNGYMVEIAFTMEGAIEKLKKTEFDLVFTDLRLPDGDGIVLLKELRVSSPALPVVLMTSYAEVSTAVEAMKQGAFDYISKPFNQDEVLNVVANALNIQKTAEVPAVKKVPKNEKEQSEGFRFIAGISSASKKLNEYVNLVGPTNMSVLITGESGTGKEVVAKAIHYQSERKKKPFVAVDCGAVPKELASSEFFGHLKGSFTGAVTDKKGHFEEANGGTLFLDEVGNLSYENQIQLLRALQERRIKPIGSSKEIEVDIRLITATNEDLLQSVGKGQFREDLYHRLNEFSIKVPELSERKEDLMIFSDYFLDKANIQLNKNVLGFSDEVIALFQKYKWPGNLRELSNVIKRATLLTTGNLIEVNSLPSELFSVTTAERSFSTKENERELIISALEESKNNKTEAAKLLNITRKTLYNKLKEYDISS